MKALAALIILANKLANKYDQRLKSLEDEDRTLYERISPVKEWTGNLVEERGTPFRDWENKYKETKNKPVPIVTPNVTIETVPPQIVAPETAPYVPLWSRTAPRRQSPPPAPYRAVPGPNMRFNNSGVIVPKTKPSSGPVIPKGPRKIHHPKLWELAQILEDQVKALPPSKRFPKVNSLVHYVRIAARRKDRDNYALEIAIRYCPARESLPVLEEILALL